MKFFISRPAVAPQIEKALRPFIKEGPEWRIGRPQPPEDDRPPILEWSARTNVQTLTLEGIGFRVVDDDALEAEEEDRDVHVERIEQEGNPDNHVDVEVIDRIAFRDPVTGRLRVYVLDN